jgi:hypothetical protein
LLQPGRQVQHSGAPVDPRAALPLRCRYAQDEWTLFKAGMGRQTKLFLRNRAFIAIRM